MTKETTEVRQENGLAKWYRETRAELSKVSWPTREQGLRLTGIVLLVTLISAIAIFGIDSLFSTVVRLIIS